LYVTCSVFHEENQDVVNAFLAKTTDAKLKPISLTSPEEAHVTGTLSIKTKPIASGQQLLPDEMTDGFYYALIEKV
jgi:16S rRNA (cytosine967-C5)-methyltransferase